MADIPNYWFPAKRHGWGWSYPRTWQGWVVIAIYVALVGAGIPAIPAATRPAVFIAYLLFLTVMLIAVCWLKGEPPRWRGGKRRAG